MVDINAERETKIEGNTVIIESQIKETMTRDEFINTYQQKVGEIQMLENQVHQYKMALGKITKKDMDETLSEFKKKYDLMKDVEIRENIIKKIQENEVLLAKKQEDFKNLVPTMKKIQEEAQAEPEKKEENPQRGEDCSRSRDGNSRGPDKLYTAGETAEKEEPESEAEVELPDVPKIELTEAEMVEADKAEKAYVAVEKEESSE